MGTQVREIVDRFERCFQRTKRFCAFVKVREKREDCGIREKFVLRRYFYISPNEKHCLRLLET